MGGKVWERKEKVPELTYYREGWRYQVRITRKKDKPSPGRECSKGEKTM